MFLLNHFHVVFGIPTMKMIRGKCAFAVVQMAYTAEQVPQPNMGDIRTVLGLVLSRLFDPPSSC